MNENHDTLKLAMGLTEQTSGGNKNLVDSVLGSQKVGKQLIIHPLDAGVDTSRDITVYRAILSGNFERTYGLDQGKVPETIEALVKELQTQFKVLYNSGLELMTVRYYTQETIDTLTLNKVILLEKRSRYTVQMVMKNEIAE
jgi:hypothetical protein